MVEQNLDDISATGTHRAWVAEGLPRHGVRAGLGAEDRNGWLDKSAASNPRHAAITRSLYSWSNYKSWTEKVRSDWKEKDPKK